MELPVQITFRNMEPSDAVTVRIKAEAAKLDTFFDRVTSCRVVVEAPHGHHQSGELFHIRVELGVPGAELIVSHQPTQHAALSQGEEAAWNKRVEVHPQHKDVYVAIRDAFTSARRQLQDYVKQQRGDVKAHEPKLRHGFGTSGP